MTDVNVQAATREIVVDEVFPHSPETIWAALIRPDLMARWLRMTPVGFEPVVGNRFTYQTSAAGEWDGTIQCEVVEVVPNRCLAYSWRGGHADNVGYGSLLDTVVSLTLEPQADGTRLRVVHSGFVLPRNETAYTNMSGGWIGVVARIGEISGEQS
ncbi:SRPBCC family protein [Sphingomonas crocodyli]|uniref:SRPBCC domain-containing protein n=1 Tax=Sphingomonas crocodyli TaxID=1979270 RepID=A0A437M6V0_9SPHN|nr:SRPBCC domain-containing protein [Sphingomonas crocodyli]RVT93379.1 SRPBCC domain-containing protein [Sphingomonas crocodyli]